MGDKKRYRRREIVGAIARLCGAESQDEHEAVARLVRDWSGWKLAEFFRDMTGREIVYNSGGLFYALADEQ